MKKQTLKIIIACIIVVIIISGIVIYYNKRTYSASFGIAFTASRLYEDADGKTFLEIEYDLDGKQYSKDLSLEIADASIAAELNEDNVDDVIGGLILLNIPVKDLKKINPDYQYADASYYLCNDLLDDYMVITSIDFQ